MTIDPSKLAQIELDTVSKMYEAIEVFAAVVHASATDDPDYVRVPRAAFFRLGEEMQRIATSALERVKEIGFSPE